MLLPGDQEQDGGCSPKATRTNTSLLCSTGTSGERTLRKVSRRLRKSSGPAQPGTGPPAASPSTRGSYRRPHPTPSFPGGAAALLTAFRQRQAQLSGSQGRSLPTSPSSAGPAQGRQPLMAPVFPGSQPANPAAPGLGRAGGHVSPRHSGSHPPGPRQPRCVPPQKGGEAAPGH